MKISNTVTEIRNVRIPDFFDLSISKRMTVKIDNGNIISVDPFSAGSNTKIDTGDSIIDGRGMVLIPGMVNMHAHTAMTLLRGTAEDCSSADWFNKHIWIYEQSLTPDDVYTGTLLGGAEMLLNGITTVADHYFAMDRAWQAYDKLGMRADLCWAVFGLGDQVEAKLEKAIAFNSAYRGKSPLINISMGPHSPYLCPDDFLKRIAGIAADEKMKLHIHVSEEEAQVTASINAHGKTPIEVLRDTGILRPCRTASSAASSELGKAAGSASIDDLPTILAHAYYATDSDLKILAESSCISAHCPKTYLRFGDSHNFLPRTLEAGAAVALGTDGAASNSTMNLYEAARLAALMGKSSAGNAEKAGLGEVLPLLFSGGRALGLPNYGKIVPGAPADLVLIDTETPSMFPGNNLFADILYSMDGRNIHSVIVNGRMVVEDGKLLTADYRGLLTEAKKISARLLATKADKPMQEY